MRWIEAVVMLVVLGACGDDPVVHFGGTGGSSGSGTGGSSGGGAPLCVPGRQEACACPGGGSEGVQICLEGGSGYTRCEGCGAGSAGGGGSGGAGGGAAGSGGEGGAGGSGGGSPCGAMQHLCGDSCAGNTPASGCLTAGPGCTPCGAPEDATPACTPAGICDFVCDDGHVKIGSACQCATECCSALDCPSGQSCSGGLCVTGCDPSACLFLCFMQGMFGICQDDLCICM